MIVFLDDSGCGGFKFTEGSTTHLAIAACVFRDYQQIEALAKALEACRIRASHHREFKHNKTKDSVKARFLVDIAGIDFALRVIFTDKQLIHSPKLRSSPSALKAFLIRMLLTKSYGQIRDAKIVIDGQDTRAFGIDDQQYLMGMVNRATPGTIRQVKFVDSKDSIGIQLADMMAGMVRVHQERPTAKTSQNLDAIRHRAYQPRGTYWNFM